MTPFPELHSETLYGWDGFIPLIKPSVPAIIDMVCEETGLTIGALKGDRKTLEISQARQLIAYLSEKHIGATHETIGGYLNKSRSTVTYAISSYLERRPYYPELEKTVRRIEVRLMREWN